MKTTKTNRKDLTLDDVLRDCDPNDPQSVRGVKAAVLLDGLCQRLDRGEASPREVATAFNAVARFIQGERGSKDLRALKPAKRRANPTRGNSVSC